MAVNLIDFLILRVFVYYKFLNITVTTVNLWMNNKKVFSSISKIRPLWIKGSANMEYRLVQNGMRINFFVQVKNTGIAGVAWVKRSETRIPAFWTYTQATYMDSSVFASN